MELATAAVHTPHLSATALAGMATPITLATTYRLQSAEHGAQLSDAPADARTGERGFIYSRWGNPTTEAAADVVSAIEHASAGSMLFASGMAAISAVFMSCLGSGDVVVAPLCVYGGTHEWLQTFAPRLGIRVEFIADASVEAFRAAAERAGDSLRLLYSESPSNPSTRLTDLAALGGLAAELGVDAVVDGTFATAYHTQALSYEGITAVINSATKFYGGHSDVLAGAVSSSSEAFMSRVATTARLFGAGLPAFDSYLLQRGLKTLAVRMRAHSENAQLLAERLEAHPSVLSVAYPGLPSHPDHELARRQMRHGFGGVLAFEVCGGSEAGRAFVEALRVVNLAVSLGSVESLVEHPASMTHAMVAREDRIAAGISDGLIRLAVGIEDVEDLWRDIEGALPSASASS